MEQTTQFTKGHKRQTIYTKHTIENKTEQHELNKTVGWIQGVSEGKSDPACCVRSTNPMTYLLIFCSNIFFLKSL